MFSMWDKNVPFVQTFWSRKRKSTNGSEPEAKKPKTYSVQKDTDHIRKLFRGNIIGGLTNVYHRHLDLSGGTESPESARIAPNGNPYNYCAFFDFNAMYLKASMEDMPTTPGIILYRGPRRAPKIENKNPKIYLGGPKSTTFYLEFFFPKIS